MQEDKWIRNQFGTGNHFRVPDGYFDNLASSVMQHIPASQAKVVELEVPVWRRHIVAISTAAASVAVAVCLTFAFKSHVVYTDTNVSAHADIVSNDYSDIDAMANYTMIDSDDMYAYMSDAE